MKSHSISRLPAHATCAADPSLDGAATALLVQLEAQTGVWGVVFPTRVAPQVSTSPGEPRARAASFDESHAGRRWAGAQAELEQLHVEEFARLLAQASVLRANLGRRAACGARVGDGGDAVAREPAAGDLEAGTSERRAVGGWGSLEALAWRTALADQCSAAAADGAQLSPALAELLDACRAPFELWPSALQLALAAASLWPSARTRAGLGRIALAEGDWRSARGCFESALNFPATERLRGEVLAELDTLAARELDAAAREHQASSRPEREGGSIGASIGASIGGATARTPHPSCS